jgi:iron complex outermembrane recepter protein
MRNVSVWLGLALIGMTAVLSSATSVHAESLDEVEVIGVRQPYRGDMPLEALPQSIQVIDSSTLNSANAIQLDRALDFVSGTVRQNNFGGMWDSFAVRGFAGDENLPSIYLVNGFSAGRGFSGRRDTINIERIEVFKGPGSAMIGRSDPGGTVNIVTKKPQFNHAGSVEASAGSHDTYRLAADYTGPINDVIAWRLNGAYEDANSFRDTVESNKYVVSPSLLTRFGANTTLSYEGELLHQEAPFDRGVVAINNQLGLVPNARFYGESNDGPITVEAMGHQLTLEQQLSDDWQLLVGLGYRTSSFEGFSSDAELAANRQSLYFANTNILARQRRYRDYDATDLSMRVELTGTFSTGSLLHHVLTGIDAYDYELDQIQNRFRVGTNQANPTYGINVFAPVYGQAQPTPAAFQNTLEEQAAQGIYLQDQIELSDAWQVQLGLRVDRYDQEIANRLNSTTQQQDKTITNPRVGVSYSISDNAMLYANYATGFRPNSGLNASGNAFDPERSRAWETGIKLHQGNWLTANIAAFFMKKSNVLTSDPIIAGFSAAIGQAESKGVELDAVIKFESNTRAQLSYAYVDAQTAEDLLEVNFGRPIPKGSPLINVPKHSANLWLTQELKLSDQSLIVGGGVQYISSRLGETGVPEFILPSYTLLNALLEYRPLNALSIAVNVDNVLDKEYYPSSYARVWVAAGTPRTYTLRARYQF